MSAHTAQTELKLIGKLILEGEMRCETGLHVGAGKGSLEIGGSDNPVVKDASAAPTCPAARCAARSARCWSSPPAWPSRPNWYTFRGARGRKCASIRATVPTTRSACCSAAIRAAWSGVQGETLETTQATPARLAVFDAPLDPESITAQMRENLDDELTEVKSENAIDRITSQANPRTLERVPAGARFKTRLVMDVLCDEDAPLFLRVLEGLRLLEDDTLGGGGSRGSGRVSFSNLRLVWRGKSHYATGAPEKEIGAGATLAAIQSGRHRIGLSPS